MASVKNIKPLTSIRAFAALWVVFFHLQGEFYSLCPCLKHFEWFIRFGASGVDLFFVLSGFILCYNHVERDKALSLDSYLEFIWLRIARIYPAYIAALLAAVGLVFAAWLFGIQDTKSHFPINILLKEALMIHVWRWGDYIPGWNYPDWSVSAEWFAYLFIFPIAIVLLRRIKNIWLYLLMAGIFLAGLAVRFSNMFQIETVILEFLAGAMLYGFRRQKNILTNGMPDITLGITFGIALLTMADPPFLEVGNTLILVGCFATSILILSYQSGIISALLSARILVYLGEVSYSIYLTHGIVQRVLKIVLHPGRFDQLSPFKSFLFFSIYLIAILGAAMSLYHLVERPCRDFLRKKSPLKIIKK
jgi:peptidoglycan/LPS O-acetylase OafA/YrhL